MDNEGRSPKKTNTRAGLVGKIFAWIFIGLIGLAIIIFGVWGVIYLINNHTEIFNHNDESSETADGNTADVPAAFDEAALQDRLQEIYNSSSDSESGEQAVDAEVQVTISSIDSERYANQARLTAIDFMNNNNNSARALELLAQLDPASLTAEETVRYYNAFSLANQNLGNLEEASRYAQLSYEAQKALEGGQSGQ